MVHGYTYSGHPVASAVALKNLEVIDRLELVARVKNDIGPYLHRRLHETFDGHPIVGEVRGTGPASPANRAYGRQETARFLPRHRQCRHAVPQLLLQFGPDQPGDPRHDGPGSALHHQGERGSRRSSAS
jgi:adenosylmethionine-8-amino-7-oxononanoate aminotransferase